MAVAGVLGISACSLFIDTSGFDGRAPNDSGAPTASDGSGEAAAPGPTSTMDASCPDDGPLPAACVAKEIPTDGLVLWLRADDGLETTDDGRVTRWRDSLPKLRPGHAGLDATQTDTGAQPLRVTESAGPAVAFGPKDALELPPGLEDFSAGLSLFVVVWPQLDATGSAGPVFALGFPAQQDSCGRLAELVIGEYGFEYRVEAERGVAEGVVDGRGWDVISAVHGGWNGGPVCAVNAPLTLRRGNEVKGTITMRSLSKALRSGTRLGRSSYFPNEYFSGKVGEVLLYDRALDEAEVGRVVTYLGRRWPRL